MRNIFDKFLGERKESLRDLNTVCLWFWKNLEEDLNLRSCKVWVATLASRNIQIVWEFDGEAR